MYREWKASEIRSGRNFSYSPPEQESEPEVEIVVEATETPEERELTPEEIAQKEREEFISLEPRISADRFHAIYENMFLSPKNHKIQYPNIKCNYRCISRHAKKYLDWD